MGLQSVSRMAMLASRGYMKRDVFKAVGNAFCDGVEISLGKINATDAFRSKSQLADLF